VSLLLVFIIMSLLIYEWFHQKSCDNRLEIAYKISLLLSVINVFVIIIIIYSGLSSLVLLFSSILLLFSISIVINFQKKCNIKVGSGSILALLTTLLITIFSFTTFNIKLKFNVPNVDIKYKKYYNDSRYEYKRKTLTPQDELVNRNESEYRPINEINRLNKSKKQ
jgi:hypothetical protein